MRRILKNIIILTIISVLATPAFAGSKKDTYEKLVFQTLMREKTVKGTEIIVFPYTVETLVAEIEADGESQMMDKPKRLERFSYYYNYYGLKTKMLFQVILLSGDKSKNISLNSVLKSVYLVDEAGKRYAAEIVEDFGMDELSEDAVAVISFPILGPSKKLLISPQSKYFSIAISNFLEQKEIQFKWQLPFKYPAGVTKILPDYLGFLNIK